MRRLVLRTSAWAVAAVGSVAVVIFVLIPLLAAQLAAITPEPIKQRVGEIALPRLAAALAYPDGRAGQAEFCDFRGGVSALETLARRVTAGLESPPPLRLAVVRADLVNAFALPGGYVVLTYGLIRAAESPEEGRRGARPRGGPRRPRPRHRGDLSHHRHLDARQPPRRRRDVRGGGRRRRARAQRPPFAGSGARGGSVRGRAAQRLGHRRPGPRAVLRTHRGAGRGRGPYPCSGSCPPTRPPWNGRKRFGRSPAPAAPPSPDPNGSGCDASAISSPPSPASSPCPEHRPRGARFRARTGRPGTGSRSVRGGERRLASRPWSGLAGRPDTTQGPPGRGVAEGAEAGGPVARELGHEVDLPGEVLAASRPRHPSPGRRGGARRR